MFNRPEKKFLFTWANLTTKTIGSGNEFTLGKPNAADCHSLSCLVVISFQPCGSVSLMHLDKLYLEMPARIKVPVGRKRRTMRLACWTSMVGGEVGTDHIEFHPTVKRQEIDCPAKDAGSACRPGLNCIRRATRTAPASKSNAWTAFVTQLCRGNGKNRSRCRIQEKTVLSGYPPAC